MRGVNPISALTKIHSQEQSFERECMYYIHSQACMCARVSLHLIKSSQNIYSQGGDGCRTAKKNNSICTHACIVGYVCVCERVCLGRHLINSFSSCMCQARNTESATKKNTHTRAPNACQTRLCRAPGRKINYVRNPLHNGVPNENTLPTARG